MHQQMLMFIQHPGFRVRPFRAPPGGEDGQRGAHEPHRRLRLSRQRTHLPGARSGGEHEGAVRRLQGLQVPLHAHRQLRRHRAVLSGSLRTGERVTNTVGRKLLRQNGNIFRWIVLAAYNPSVDESVPQTKQRMNHLGTSESLHKSRILPVKQC